MRDFLCTVDALYLSRVPGHYRVQPALDRFRRHVIPDAVYASPKKLNLGASFRRLPGYINVDVLAERQPDIVSDITTLDFAADNEFDLLRASHVLEHFPLERIPAVLAEWRRVLRSGGYFVVCVPDYRRLAWRTILKSSGLELDAATYRNGWINGVFALDLPPEYRHQIVFTRRSLMHLLEQTGFRIAGTLHYRKEHPFTLGITDNSCTPYSLNIAAIKTSPQ